MREGVGVGRECVALGGGAADMGGLFGELHLLLLEDPSDHW